VAMKDLVWCQISRVLHGAQLLSSFLSDFSVREVLSCFVFELYFVVRGLNVVVSGSVGVRVNLNV